jgi:hypothetical protein
MTERTSVKLIHPYEIMRIAYLDFSIVIIKTPHSMKPSLYHLLQHFMQMSSLSAGNDPFFVHPQVWTMPACSNQLEILSDRFVEVLKRIGSTR